MSIPNSIFDVYGHRRANTHMAPIQNKPVVQGWQNRWKDYEAFVIASGPSLTEEDVETVRLWREKNDNRRVIVTNNTFQIALWADILFFHDLKWWNVYKNQVNIDAVTVSHVQDKKVNKLGRPGFKSFGNSGTGAVSLAVYAGCNKIYLLGVDGKKKDGKVHWHGNHVKPLGNAMSMPKWKDHFSKVGEYAKSRGVEVINMSRDTAIHCFKKQSLDELRG